MTEDDAMGEAEKIVLDLNDEWKHGQFTMTQVIASALQRHYDKGWNDAVEAAAKVAENSSYGEGMPETEEDCGCYLYEVDIFKEIEKLKR